jgi:nitrogen regulatory protein PII
MKLVKCVIQPQKLDEVVQALANIVPGMTVSEVRGHGHQKGHSMVYRGLEYEVSLLPKIVIDIVADDNRVDDIVKTVVESSRTGQIGDGRIFVIPVEENYHIRSGFMDLG